MEHRARSAMEKMCIFSVTVCLMGLFMVIWNLPVAWPQFLIYNHTPSVPVGWYLMLPVGEVEDGDVVGFKAPADAETVALERGWLKADDVMLKKVGAMPRERFEIDDEQGFYVNGKYIGQVQQFDGKGMTMPHIEQGQHIVEDGCFLPVTENPFSYDGRYYGTVPLADIAFRAVQLNPFAR